MSTGEFLTRWTVRLALVGYAGAVALRLLPGRSLHRQAAERWLWTVGCLLYLGHVVAAFHFYHGWSHWAAYQETARRTGEEVGVAWGGGLYLNYLFTAAWVADAAWWWRGLQAYESRPRWVGRVLHAFLAFMAFNGAVVFATGLVRWVGLAVSLALGVLGWLRWRRGRQGPARPSEEGS
jgi:hypothetical protein